MGSMTKRTISFAYEEVNITILNIKIYSNEISF